MTTKIMLQAKGYKSRVVTLEYVRHLRTHTPTMVGGGAPNVDRDLYRIVETGHEIEILTPSNDCRMFPGLLTVRPSQAAQYGLRPRA